MTILTTTSKVFLCPLQKPKNTPTTRINYMKKLAIVLAVMFACCFAGCSAIKKPTVNVESVTPSGIGLSSVTFNVKIAIDNPNPFGAHLTKLAFDIYYYDNGYHYLGHGEKKDISIKANGVTEVTVPVKVEDIQVLKTLFTLAKSGKVKLKVKGTAYIDLKVTSFGIPFEEIKTIKL